MRQGNRNGGQYQEETEKKRRIVTVSDGGHSGYFMKP